MGTITLGCLVLLGFMTQAFALALVGPFLPALFGVIGYLELQATRRESRSSRLDWDGTRLWLLETDLQAKTIDSPQQLTRDASIDDILVKPDGLVFRSDSGQLTVRGFPKFERERLLQAIHAP